MADLALIIHAEPKLCFYRGARPADCDLAWPRLIDIGEIRSALRIDGGETPTARIVLDNADGGLTSQVAAHAPLAEASIQRDGMEIFRGVVMEITIGASLTIGLEA